MIRIPAHLFYCVAVLACAVPAAAQAPQNPTQSASSTPSYATVARLVLGAPIVIDARVTDASRLKPEESPGLAPGRARFFVEADVAALIRGTGAIPTHIGFLADIPLDSRGKPPKLKKARLMLF